MVQRFDFLVIGSGIAGMSFALKVASKGKLPWYAKLIWKKLTHISLREASPR